MPRPNLNDRTNQLRVDGTCAALYWPRYEHTFAQKLRNNGLELAACLIALPSAVCIDSLRPYLFSPLAVVFPICDSLRWAQHRLYNRDTSGASPFDKFPFLTTWLLVVLLPELASHAGPRMWEATLFVSAAVVAACWTNSVTTHYLSYLTSHHALSPATQSKWTAAFRMLWRRSLEVNPSRELSGEESRIFSRAVSAVSPLPIAAVTNLGAPAFCCSGIRTAADRPAASDTSAVVSGRRLGVDRCRCCSMVCL